MPASPVTDYLARLRQDFRTGSATERTYYGALQALVEAIQPGVRAPFEQKRIDCGAIDFHVKRRDLTIGYIEAKDVGASLDDAESTEQLKKRYLPNLPNLILTNYLEFRWYRNGARQRTSILGRVDARGIIRSTAQAEDDLRSLLKDFLAVAPEGAANAKDLATRLAHFAHEIRIVIGESLTQGRASSLITDLRDAVHKQLIPDLTDAQFADMFAQTLVYGFFAARCNHKAGPFQRLGAAGEIPKTNPFLRQLFEAITGLALNDEPFVGYVDDAIQLLDRTDMAGVLADFGHRTGRADPVVHFYETFLKEYDPKLRELRGVYYTPEPVVSYMVRSVDHLLRTRFSLSDGLADTAQITYERETEDGGKETATAPRVLVLDPALGTGTFLYAIVDLVRERLRQRRDAGLWSSFVREQLLPRVFGFELLMAPYAVAHLKLGMQLAAQDLSEAERATWAYDFSGDERLGVYLTNTLEEAARKAETLFGPYRAITQEANAAADIKRDKPIMVVIGNPPYSGHSANRSWETKNGKRVPTFIGKLLQDYYRVDGQPLGEKNPKWLQDDYVKFIRFGQWRIEESGGGIVALITNHSYLDNPTFRGMRQQLMQAFTDIYILDLHGNTKKRERAPDGGKDENVFDIQQGVAITLFVRNPSLDGPARVWHADLWGLREFKYAALSEATCEALRWGQLQPRSPSYLFVPQDTALLDEYQHRWSLADLFPVNSVGIVTARDQFAVAFGPEELAARIASFVDPAKSDDEARADRLKAADKLDVSAARQSLAEIDWEREAEKPQAERAVQTMLYRPFDTRSIVYEDAVLERPRREVMRHMLAGTNMALCVGRAGVVVGAGEWDVAFCSRLTEDFNLFYRGGSTNFPLYLYPDAGGLFPSGGAGFQPAAVPGVGDSLQITRRRLPHWQVGGSTYFITFRLKGSARGGAGFQPAPETTAGWKPAPPAEGVAGWKPAVPTTPAGWKPALPGPVRELSLEERKVVLGALLFWHGRKWTVQMVTVLPDHVHVLATPLEQAAGSWFPLSEILHGVKRHSALEINRLRGTRGAVWQGESFDRIVRNAEEFDEKATYILNNAPKAGLVSDAWEYDGLWVDQEGGSRRLETCATGGAGFQPAARRANLNPACVAEMEQRLALRFIPDGHGDLSTTFGPEDVFDYIYAILHSPTYRSRYAEFLKRDFPRIPFTFSRDLFAALVAKGGDLIALHLMESPLLDTPITSFPEPGLDTVERVAYNDNQRRVYINKTQYFDGVPKAVWDFHVGGYQVCEKWLKDRKGRKLDNNDLQHYQKIVVALHETIRLMAEVDALIPSWPIT